MFNMIELTYVSMNEGTTNSDFKKDHIAIVAVLKHKLYGYVVCATTTHLYYLGTRDDIRTYQMAYILNKVFLHIIP